MLVDIASLKDAVAVEILNRAYDLLAANKAQDEELQIAQSICFVGSDSPAVSAAIQRYTALADAVTDGVFSASLESWQAKKQ